MVVICVFMTSSSAAHVLVGGVDVANELLDAVVVGDEGFASRRSRRQGWWRGRDDVTARERWSQTRLTTQLATSGSEAIAVPSSARVAAGLSKRQAVVSPSGSQSFSWAVGALDGTLHLDVVL